MMPDAPSPFVTVQEIAALLRVPVSRVYAWTARRDPGSIPRYKGGRCLLFDPVEVVAWFKSEQRVGQDLGPRNRVRLARSRRGRLTEVTSPRRITVTSSCGGNDARTRNDDDPNRPRRVPHPQGPRAAARGHPEQRAPSASQPRATADSDGPDDARRGLGDHDDV